MKTLPDRAITMTFHSHQTKRREMWWRATLTFPPDADAATVLPISMVDGLGEPVESAVFEFAGLEIRISGGKGQMTYADFINGKHEKALWVYRKGMLPIPGALTFA